MRTIVVRRYVCGVVVSRRDSRRTDRHGRAGGARRAVRVLPGRLHGSRGARHARRRRTVRPRPETRGARSLARRLGAVSRPPVPPISTSPISWHSGSRVGCLVRHRARPHRRGGRRPTATVTPRRPRPRAGRRTLMCKTDVMTIVNGKRARAGGPAGRQQERCNHEHDCNGNANG